MSDCSLKPSGRSLIGSRLTTGPDSFMPAGSAGLSPRPSVDTTIFTPGTSDTSFIASNSVRTDSSSETEGTRMICGVTDPSCITGTNAVPRKGNAAPAATSRATAIATTVFSWPTDQSSRRRYPGFIIRITNVSWSAPPFSM
jgi:hypothetical protein